MSQHADVLVWGHGPEIFEVFLEPTCPFSVRAFNKFDALLAHVGEENITLKIRLQSQPWHLYSGLIVRYILAAACESKEAAKKVMQAVADHREGTVIGELKLFTVIGYRLHDLFRGLFTFAGGGKDIYPCRRLRK